jgi:polyhydroxyalkanoate synthesis regulator protein
MQGNGAFDLMEETARRNVEMFQEAMRMWMPFQTAAAEKEAGSGTGKSGEAESELDALRRQLRDMQKTIDSIAKKD